MVRIPSRGMRRSSCPGFLPPVVQEDETDSGIAPGPKGLHQNWVEAISWIARLTPGGSVQSIGSITIVRSGLALTAFNAVFALDRPCPPDQLGEPIENILVRGGTPWCLITTDETSPDLQRVIDAFGLHLGGTLPGMVWDRLPESVPATPEGFAIRRLHDSPDARTFARTMMEGFGAAPDLLDRWAEGVVASGPQLSMKGGLYVAYARNQPVGTAVRLTTGRIAGVYGVSTLAQFRRRGLGAAITCRAAVDGREEGCRLSYLQSSELGRPVYEKIGYRFVENYRLWVPEARSAARPS